MKVFVAGATGVLGRAAVPQLLAAGHEVFGLARTPEKLLRVKMMNAEPMRGDVLDADAMRRIVTEIQPDAIVNLATAIPLKLRVNPKDWERNDRVRREGTANLLAAAQSIDLKLFVQESAGYVCHAQGEKWITEESSLTEHSFLRATIHMENAVRAATVPATLLRFSALMSADSWHTQQSVTALRRGLLPVIGDGGNYVSLIHAQDAAQAVVLALTNPQKSAGQTFNVTDDSPAPMRDILPLAAELLGAAKPRSAPLLMAKMIAGAITVEVFTASYRLANAKIKQTLGFAPRYPTYREIWAQIVREIGQRDFAPSDDLK